MARLIQQMAWVNELSEVGGAQCYSLSPGVQHGTWTKT